MPGRARHRLSQLLKGARMPRRTVRLRLTLLYSGLFLASSAVLLGITYVVVRNLTGGPYVSISDHVVTIAGVRVVGGPFPGAAGATVRSGGSGQVTQFSAGSGSGSGSGSGPPTPTPKQLEAQARQLQRVAIVYHNSELHHLVITYGIALGIMALVSLVLGWLVAGRILRPLRTITATTRAIGVTDLHQRLALSGPDDELQELGETVDELLERLETSFASQKQFVANASHELRTPLARQRTLGQVALSDPGATVESLRRAHQRILDSGEEQEQLIDTLLTLSRVQGGALKSTPVELASLVRELLHARQSEATARGLRIRSELEPVRLQGDQRLIERLAANLIDNALRHNVPGGSVMVTTGTRGGAACLWITNDGPVVRPDDIERLYEPFERLDGQRPSSGVGFGLGLCIVKAVASAHGATLDTQARPTGGLRVEARFRPIPGDDHVRPPTGDPVTTSIG
jgi:signal transduction histidine kinase